MAILTGFPPSNTINPTTYICDETDDTPGVNICYLHRRNVWLESRKPDDGSWTTYQTLGQEVGRLLSRLAENGLAIVIDWERDHPLTAFLKRLDWQIDQGWCVCGGIRQALSLSFVQSVPWFVFFEYHVVHGLSLQLGTDVRATWMKSWGWQKTDHWCQARMEEALEEKTPLEKILVKTFGDAKVDIRTRIDFVPERATSLLSSVTKE